MDLFVLIFGIIYFFKFRALRKEKNAVRRKRQMKLRGESSNEIKLYRVFSSLAVDLIVVSFFLIFAIRILLKDVVFMMLEIDSIFLEFCRCN